MINHLGRAWFLSLVVGFLIPSFQVQATYIVPANGLIGYWPGDSNANDLSPTGNNGTFQGSYAPGLFGNAFNLGTGKVVIPNNAVYDAFRSYDGYSIGFWFKGTSIGANNGLFLGQDEGSGFNNKWFIDYGYSFYGNGPYYFFHVNDDQGERIFIPSQSKPTPTNWNQLTVTVNNTNNGYVTFYLNGKAIGGGAMGNYGLSTTAPLVFGQAEALTYNGLMSDVVIYNRVLADDEIAQLASPPTIDLGIRTSQVEVCWNSTSNATYSLDYRSALTTNLWTPLYSCIKATNSQTCILDNLLRGEPTRFYRVTATNCVP